MYLGDRNFCDRFIISAIVDKDAFFVMRYHRNSQRWRLKNDKVKHFKRPDSNGGVVSEQEIEMEMADDSWANARRISVELKENTRKGESALQIITNLPSSVTAAKISDAYRSRWKIETCLGHLAQSLNAEIKTLAYPGAAGLSFCLALTLFNMMSTIRSALRRHKKASDKFEISLYYMAQEIKTSMTGMLIAIEKDHWKIYSEMTTAQFAKFMHNTAGNAQLKRYKKHKKLIKKPPPKRVFTGKRHVASQTLLNQRKTTA